MVNYANEAITAKGVDGQALTLVRADDEETQAALNSIVEQNGGTTKYNVADYKPKGVDNSQWMKSLADSRLVADLSLPGSHDACTAEGWQSKLFSPIAESTAKTQDLTIREQLKVGMRVFDLRPERVFEETAYVLRCSHGFMFTNMLVHDFFLQLKEFLTANPSEFCILTVDLSATADKEAWGKEFSAMIGSAEFAGLFAGQVHGLDASFVERSDVYVEAATDARDVLHVFGLVRHNRACSACEQHVGHVVHRYVVGNVVHQRCSVAHVIDAIA
jgi:hypothetical protein